MTAIKDQANSVYRDFVTDGVPASGPNDPSKSDIRNLFGAVELAIGASQANIQTVSNVTARDTFYANEANRSKLVYVNNNNGSATDPANGVYEYVNGSARIAQGFYNGVASVVQPLVDQMKAIAASATPEIQTLNRGGFYDPNGILGEPAIYLTRRYYARRGGVVMDLNPIANAESDRAGYSKIILGDQGAVNLLVADPNDNKIKLVPFSNGGFAIPAGGMVMASLWNGFMTTPLPINRVEEGLRANLFPGGKTMDGPVLTFGSFDRVELADGPLKTAGFTLGIRGPVNDRALAGARLSDPYTKGARAIVTFRVQTNIDNEFGSEETFFWRDDQGSPIGGKEQTVQAVLSARERIYRLDFINTFDRVDYFYVGRNMSGAPSGARAIITGLQVNWTKLGASEIRPDDFPSAAGSVDLSTLIIPPALWLSAGRTLPFQVGNLLSTTADAQVIATLETGKPISGDMQIVTSRSGDPILVSGDTAGANATLTARAAGKQAFVRRTMTVAIAPATKTGTVRYAQIGDSLTNRYIPSSVLRTLNSRGMTATAIGTMKGFPDGVLGEGREGKQWGEMTNQRATLMPVTDTAAYLAMGEPDQKQYNPFIRPSTSGDPASLVYNGYIFDYAFYLERFGLAAPTHVVLALGTNDISFNPSATALDQIANGMRVMVAQILAAVPGVKIGLLQHTVGRSAGGEDRWPTHCRAIRSMSAYLRQLNNNAVVMLPAYVHQSRDAGWPFTVQNTTDAGVETVVMSDEIHFESTNRSIAAEVAANWVMAS